MCRLDEILSSITSVSRNPNWFEIVGFWIEKAQREKRNVHHYRQMRIGWALVVAILFLFIWWQHHDTMNMLDRRLILAIRRHTVQHSKHHATILREFNSTLQISQSDISQTQRYKDLLENKTEWLRVLEDELRETEQHIWTLRRDRQRLDQHLVTLLQEEKMCGSSKGR